LGIGSKEIQYEPILLMNDKTIKLIVCGYSFSFIYKFNGDLLCFGNNCSGQLGFCNISDKMNPALLMNDPNIKSISCGQDHTCILKKNGELITFGSNK
jgi:alpha-tubulin suppressor-like RCC1 family protein